MKIFTKDLTNENGTENCVAAKRLDVKMCQTLIGRNRLIRFLNRFNDLFDFSSVWEMEMVCGRL